MFPLELYEFAMPPEPSSMLCERLEMPMRRGLILLPHATREYNRCHEAVVIHSAVGSDFCDGDKVLITASAQLAVTFGYGKDERTLYVVTPHQVLMKLRSFDEKPVEKGTPHHLAGFGSRDHEEFAEAGKRFDEGDPAGLH